MQGFFGEKLKKSLSFLTLKMKTLSSVIVFAVMSSIAAIPAAALSILVHLSVYKVSVIYQLYIYPVFILALVILSIYLYRKKGKKQASLFTLSFTMLPVFIVAGYPLLKFIETAANVCGGENYLLGVLFYAVFPASVGYFTLTGTYIINIYNKKLKEKMLYAFIYFLFASAVGFTLLMRAYNCGQL